MAKKKNLDSLEIKLSDDENKNWIKEVDICRRWKADRYHIQWESNYKEYNSEWWKKSVEGQNVSIDSLEAFRMIYVLIPELIFQDPTLVIKPRKLTSERTAKIKKELLSRAWELSKTAEESEDILLDGFLAMGVAFKGYDSEYTYTNKQVRIKDAINKLEEKIKMNKLVLGKIPVDMAKRYVELEKLYKEDAKGMVNEKDENIIKELPYAKQIDPIRYLFDRFAKKPSKALWQGYDYFLKQEEFDKKYTEVAGKIQKSKNNEPSIFAINSNGDIEQIDDEVNEIDVPMIRLTRIFYKKTDELGNKRVAEMILADGYDKPIINRYSPIPYRKLPFEILRFFPDNRNYVPMPAVSIIKQYSRLITIMQTKLLNSMNSVHMKLLGDKNLFNDETKKALTSPQDEFIPLDFTKEGIEDIRKVLMLLPQDVTKIRVLSDGIAVLKTDVNEILGVTRQAEGQVSRTTATEAAILDKHLVAKIGRLQKKVDTYVTSITHTFNLIIDKMYKMDDYVEILGEGKVPEKIVFNMQKGVISVDGKQDTNALELQNLEGELEKTNKDIKVINNAEINKLQKYRTLDNLYRIKNNLAKRYEEVIQRLNSTDLQSEISIEIETGSTGIRNEIVEKRKNLEIYKAVIQNPNGNTIFALKWLLRKSKVPEIEINQMVNTTGLLSPADEFVKLLSTEQMPKPNPEENFPEHIYSHEQQVQVINNLPLEEGIKEQLQRAIGQHILDTEQLMQKKTGETSKGLKSMPKDRSSLYTPDVNEAIDNSEILDGGEQILS